MLHAVARLHHRWSEPEAHTVHEPFAQNPSCVEALRSRRYQPGDGPRGIVAVDADQFGEVVSRPDRHDTKCRVRVRREQPVGDLVDRAVTTDRHHVAGALAHSLRCESLAMPRTLGPRDIHCPSLCSKRPGDHVFGLARSASPRSWVDDEMSVEHAATRYNSPAL